MKKYLLMFLSMLTTQSWALSISINSPANGTVYPATQTSVTLNGSVSEAPNGSGSVVCTGNRNATFATQNSTTWVRGFPLSNGLNTISCIYTKGAESASVTINVSRGNSNPSNVPPNAVMGAFTLTGPAPHNVKFSSGSYDTDGTIASHLWTYGDGATSTTDAIHYHLYTQAGTYTAKLVVTDNLGASSEVTKVITVTAPTQNQNATLLGIDADNDGIRDDVQTWIETNYSSQPAVKIAAQKFAQAYQNAFANKDNVSNSIAATKNLIKSNQCLLKTLMA